MGSFKSASDSHQATASGLPQRGGCARVFLLIAAAFFGGLIIAAGVGCGFGIHLTSSSLGAVSWLGRGLVAIIAIVAFVTSMVCGTVGVALFGPSPTSDRVRGIAAVIGAIGTLFVAAQVILPIAVVAGGTAAWVYSANSELLTYLRPSDVFYRVSGHRDTEHLPVRGRFLMYR